MEHDLIGRGGLGDGGGEVRRGSRQGFILLVAAAKEALDGLRHSTLDIAQQTGLILGDHDEADDDGSHRQQSDNHGDQTAAGALLFLLPDDLIAHLLRLRIAGAAGFFAAGGIGHLRAADTGSVLRLLGRSIILLAHRALHGSLLGRSILHRAAALRSADGTVCLHGRTGRDGLPDGTADFRRRLLHRFALHLLIRVAAGTAGTVFIHVTAGTAHSIPADRAVGMHAALALAGLPHRTAYVLTADRTVCTHRGAHGMLLPVLVHRDGARRDGAAGNRAQLLQGGIALRLHRPAQRRGLLLLGLLPVGTLAAEGCRAGNTLADDLRVRRGGDTVSHRIALHRSLLHFFLSSFRLLLPCIIILRMPLGAAAAVVFSIVLSRHRRYRAGLLLIVIEQIHVMLLYSKALREKIPSTAHIFSKSGIPYYSALPALPQPRHGPTM